jgi:hypothetical protein
VSNGVQVEAVALAVVQTTLSIVIVPDSGRERYMFCVIDDTFVEEDTPA